MAAVAAPGEGEIDETQTRRCPRWPWRQATPHLLTATTFINLTRSLNGLAIHTLARTSARPPRKRPSSQENHQHDDNNMRFRVACLPRRYARSTCQGMARTAMTSHRHVVFAQQGSPRADPSLACPACPSANGGAPRGDFAGQIASPRLRRHEESRARRLCAACCSCLPREG
jgi:hypothetical protein